MNTETKRCRLTEFVLSIKTAPHNSWFQPGGWGPYYTAAEAESARVRADKLWMSARVRKATVDARLTSEQIKDLRALGQPVAVLGEVVS